MLKPLIELTNDELLERYKVAVNWTSKRMQVTGTTKNSLGEPYNHKQFLVALKRIEELEDEMNKRGIVF